MWDMVTCLACGIDFPRDIEMCPSRYLSDHSEEHMEKVAFALPKKKPKNGWTRNQLLRAIKRSQPASKHRTNGA